MLAEPLKKCPACKKAGLRRLVGGGAGLIFKGTGFYITDYKNKQGGAKKDGGGESKSTEAKSTEAKPASTTKASESKPAAPAAVATPKK